MNALSPDLGLEAVPRPLRSFRLGVLTLAHFLNDGAVNFLPGILPAVLVRLALPDADAGVIMSALLIGQALQPVMGWLADRYGRRWFFLPGLCLSTAGAALVGVADSFALLIVVLLAVGVGNSAFHPPGLAAARDLAHERHASRVMSIFLVGGEIGRGLWPFLASLIVVRFGFHGLLIFLIPTVLVAPWLFRAVPESGLVRTERAGRPWPSRVRPLLPLLGYAGLRSLLVYASVTLIPLLWYRAGGSLVVGATLISVQLLVGVIGNLGGGWLADHLGRRPVLAVMSLLSPLFLLAYLLVPLPWGYLLLGGLGITLFATLPVTIPISQDLCPDEPAFASGVALGLGNALGALGLLLLGALIPVIGIERTIWCAAGIGLLALPVALWGLPTEHPAHLTGGSR
ncbi:Major facilitator superfamily MFS-1 [mine drainage metagenome]|uniref:Major facilitator superfamily MFS-1 n=1 Tax=mine drainage metagenome TaxID=410659 RepID=T1A4L2_9ZZZZ